MTVDPKIQEVLDQNALIADALYDIVQLQGLPQQGTYQATLLQDAKTKVNALNPAKYVFP